MRNLTLFAFSAVLIFNACADANNRYPSSTNNSDGGLEVALNQTPQVLWSSEDGKTTVVVQVGVRDVQGVPLSSSEVDFTMQVDGEPLDTESLLQSDSQVLESNLFYALVLDASFSMLEHDPPAFQPMLDAASQSVVTLQNEWSQQAGEMDFFVSWFNEPVYMQSGNWEPADIRAIPAPAAGTSTKLFGATRVVANELFARHQGGVFDGARDQYVMVVFSDGADNYSFFDNSSLNESGQTTSGADFVKTGAEATTLEDATAAIEAHPSLRVHVIGLGDGVKDDELQALADAGDGLYLKNPSSTEIDDVFARLTKEFATLETQGATMPLPPADYTFTILATQKSTGETGTVSFRFHGGDQQAGYLP